MIKYLIPCIALLAGLSAGPALGQEDGPAFPIGQVTPVQPPQKDWDSKIPPRAEWIDDNPLRQDRTRVSPEQPDFGGNPALSGNKDGKGDDFSALRAEGTESVAQIIDPVRLRLHSGKIVQLAGIDIPDLDPYEPGEISVAVRDRLAQLLQNKQVRLYVTKDAKEGRVNRMGDRLAHIVRSDDGLWIQGNLLSEGLARVRPAARNPEMAAQMIAREDAARAEGKGYWAEGKHPVLTADKAIEGVGQWAVVEGTVRAAATVNNVVYLNFGPDWRSDFTVGIDSGVRREMNKAGVNPLDFGGKKLRVRGWVENYNGPYIRLAHPAWLEVRP